MNQQTDKQLITCVFYDGSCPLCSKEVKLYKTLAANDALRNKYTNEIEIEWIDINKSTTALKEESIKYDDAMQLKHLKDTSGIHKVGIDAVLSIWDKIPYFQKLSKHLKKISATYPLLDKAYRFTTNHWLKSYRQKKGSA